MEIKGTNPSTITTSSPDRPDLSKSQTIKLDIENWKSGQILKAIVTASNPQHTRLNIQGVTAETPTPPKLELQVGQQLTLKVTSKNTIPDLKLLSIEKMDKPVQHIVNEQLRVQLPRQQPLTHLLSDIKTITNSPKLQQLLPAEVVQHANKIIAALPEAQQLKSPQAVKHALQNNGLFLEQNLSQAKQTDSAKTADTDLRSVLLRLAVIIRASLKTPPSATHPIINPALANNLTAVIHRQAPQPQATVASKLANIANVEQLKLEVLKNIESSLARIQSMQLTSVKVDDTANPLWALELPIRNQESLDLFDIRLQQDQQGKENDPATHRWSLLLAFDLEGLGPVQVRVNWFNEKISASFWIKQTETHELFSQHMDTLQQRLRTAGLDIEQLSLNEGELKTNTATNWQPILDEKV